MTKVRIKEDGLYVYVDYMPPKLRTSNYESVPNPKLPVKAEILSHNQNHLNFLSNSREERERESRSSISTFKSSFSIPNEYETLREEGSPRPCTMLAKHYAKNSN